MGQNDIFDLGRVHIFPAGDDHILDAILYVDKTIGVNGCDITCSQPPVLCNGLCRRLRPVPVFKHDMATFDPNLTLNVRLNVLAAFINNADIGMKKGSAG